MHSIPSEYKQNITKILQFLTFSARLLRIGEAVDVIAIDTQGDLYFSPKYKIRDPREISRFCSSLVVMVSATGHSHDEDNEPHNKDDELVELQLVHFSVKEYLKSDRLDSTIAKNFQEISARVSIAKIYLVYLLYFDRNIPPEEIKKTFPLAQYSAIFWMTHAKVAESEDKRLLGLIKQFFCSQQKSHKICYSLYCPDKSSLYTNKLASGLYYAALGGLPIAMKCLLSRGADVNAQGGYYGDALSATSARGHEKVVKLLLEKEAKVERD